MSNTINRKIKLICNEQSKERKDEFYNLFRHLYYNLHKVANHAINEMYLAHCYETLIKNKELEENHLLFAEVSELESLIQKELEKPKKEINKDRIQELKKAKNHSIGRAKIKAKNMLYGENGFYEKTQGNIAFQVFTTYFANSSFLQKYKALSSIYTNCAQQVGKEFVNDLAKMNSGDSTLRTYKKGYPAYISKRAITNIQESTENSFDCKILGYEVKMLLGKLKNKKYKIDYSTMKILQGVLKGENTISDSNIKFVPRNTQGNDSDEIYLNLTLQLPERSTFLDKNICVGVDLGINTPAYLALNNGFERKWVGDRESFLNERLKFSRLRERAKQISDINKNDKKKVNRGKAKAERLFNRVKLGESNFVKTYNHFVSKQVIDFALKNNAGTIKIEFLKGFSKDEPNSFVLRNWSYFQLQQFITYKAKQQNIKVLTIDPYHTSQTCSECGHYESEQRDKQKFTCKSCGYEENADYNGARNIAKSSKVVNSIEQCEFYLKSKSKDKEEKKELLVLANQ